jgi:hypothetical protein
LGSRSPSTSPARMASTSASATARRGACGQRCGCRCDPARSAMIGREVSSKLKLSKFHESSLARSSNFFRHCCGVRVIPAIVPADFVHVIVLIDIIQPGRLRRPPAEARQAAPRVGVGTICLNSYVRVIPAIAPADFVHAIVCIDIIQPGRLRRPPTEARQAAPRVGGGPFV